jgi:hypothetical protein
VSAGQVVYNKDPTVGTPGEEKMNSLRRILSSCLLIVLLAKASSAADNDDNGTAIVGFRVGMTIDEAIREINDAYGHVVLENKKLGPNVTGTWSRTTHRDCTTLYCKGNTMMPDASHTSLQFSNQILHRIELVFPLKKMEVSESIAVLRKASWQTDDDAIKEANKAGYENVIFINSILEKLESKYGPFMQVGDRIWGSRPRAIYDPSGLYPTLSFGSNRTVLHLGKSAQPPHMIKIEKPVGTKALLTVCIYRGFGDDVNLCVTMQKLPVLPPEEHRARGEF